MDWYTNEQDQQVLAVEDDASRRVFDMIESDASSASQSVALLDRVREEWEAPVPILEVITDHGSEFINTHQNERPCLDHEFERYLDEHEITPSARLDGLNRTGRSSGSSRTTTNTASGSELLTSSSPSTTQSGLT